MSNDEFQDGMNERQDGLNEMMRTASDSSTNLRAMYADLQRMYNAKCYELRECREALEPFAAAFNRVPARDRDLDGIDEFKIERVLYLQEQPTVGDLRRATAITANEDNGIGERK